MINNTIYFFYHYLAHTMAVLVIKPMTRHMVGDWLSLLHQIPRTVYNNSYTFNWANKRLFTSVYKHVSLQMTWSWKRFTAAIIAANEWSFACVLSHVSFKFVCTSKWPATPLRTKKEGNVKHNSSHLIFWWQVVHHWFLLGRRV